jgi:transcriptional regulator with XRE-family HTH domain
MNEKKSKKIKKALIDKGVTQTEIARKAGVSTSTVWQVVSGRSRSAKIESIIKEITGVEL